MITIGKQPETAPHGHIHIPRRIPFRGDAASWLGYPAWFRRKEDREIFGFTKMYLLRSTYRHRYSGSSLFKKWVLADAATGAVIVRCETREAISKFIRRAKPFWNLYRLAFACRLASCNTTGPQKWNSTPIEFSDEFNALLVVAKMEGLTGDTKLKDIYASRNPNSSLAG